MDPVSIGLSVAGLVVAVGTAITSAVANTVATKQSSDLQLSEANKSAALQKKVLAMQVEEAKRQQKQQLQQSSARNLGDVYQSQADMANKTSAAQVQAGDDMRATLAKAYLGGGQ